MRIMRTALRFACPDCGRKLRPIESMSVATMVTRRKCAGCRVMWQLVVTPLRVGDSMRVDRVVLARVEQKLTVIQ